MEWNELPNKTHQAMLEQGRATIRPDWSLIGQIRWTAFVIWKNAATLQPGMVSVVAAKQWAEAMLLKLREADP